jgi:hypothetical protein
MPMTPSNPDDKNGAPTPEEGESAASGKFARDDVARVDSDRELATDNRPQIGGARTEAVSEGSGSGTSPREVNESESAAVSEAAADHASAKTIEIDQLDARAAGADLADTIEVASTIDDLVVYLDGYLEGPERERVERLLVNSPESRAHLAGLQNAWDALDCLPRPACSSDFTESTMKLVVQKELASATGKRWMWRRWLSVLAVAATLLMSLGVGFATTRYWRSTEEREFLEAYPLIENWEKYQVIGDFEFLLRLDDEGLFAREVGNAP